MSSQYNHELRLDRALEHLQSLESEVKRWLGTNPYSYFLEFDPQGGENIIRVWSYGTMPSQFGLIISDCIHNLRSALDNLVYDLAISYLGIDPLPEGRAKKLEFPIFGNKAMSDGECRTKIGCIHPGAQTIIKGLQPCNRGNDFASDPLWTLQRLSNIDKHRLVYTTLLTRDETAFGPGYYSRTYDVTFKSGGIEKTAEIVRYRVRYTDPSGKVDVQFHQSFDIAFGQGSPKRGEKVGPTLGQLRHYILTRIVSDLTPYLIQIPIVRVSQPYSLLPSRG